MAFLVSPADHPWPWQEGIALLHTYIHAFCPGCQGQRASYKDVSHIHAPISPYPSFKALKQFPKTFSMQNKSPWMCSFCARIYIMVCIYVQTMVFYINIISHFILNGYYYYQYAVIMSWMWLKLATHYPSQPKSMFDHFWDSTHPPVCPESGWFSCPVKKVTPKYGSTIKSFNFSIRLSTHHIYNMYHKAD